MKKRIAILVFFIIFGCSKKVKTYVPFIEGYWTISQVKKDNKIIKEYTISTSVDYFKVNNDLTGFRKKVKPKLDGTFTITEHETPFTLELKDDSLNIIYTSTSDSLKETILAASKESLTISNTDGFVYIYKPFKKFNF